MLKIKFLGTGGAEGWPAPFCECDYCKKARKLGGKNLRSRSSLLINDNLLLDLNPDLHLQSLNYGLDLTKVKNILISHAHLDHLDVSTLTKRRNNYIDTSTRTLQIWLKKEIAAILKERIKVLDGTDFKDLEDLELNQIKVQEEIKLNGIQIQPVLANHNPINECLNFIIKDKDKKIFIGYDTGWPLAETINVLKNMKLDLVILDCTFGKYNSQKFNNEYHMGIDKVIEFKNFLKEHNSLKNDSQVFATHFSHLGELMQEELESRLTKHNIKAAYDGLELLL